MDVICIDAMVEQRLAPGDYRIADLASRLKRSRTTISRYINRYNLPVVDIIYKHKPVKAIRLDDFAVAKLLEVIDSEAIGDEPCANHVRMNEVIPGVDHVQMEEPTMDKHRFNLEIECARLTVELKRLDDLERLLAEKERTIVSQASEISTLKTFMVIQHKDKPINLIPARRGLLGSIKQWLMGD